MKRILIFLAVVIFLLIIGVSYARYHVRESFSESDSRAAQKIAHGVKKEKTRDLYVLYLKDEEFQPYDFLVTRRLFMNYTKRKEYMIAIDKIADTINENRKLSEAEFNEICDYVLFPDKDSKGLVLQNKVFPKKKIKINVQ